MVLIRFHIIVIIAGGMTVVLLVSDIAALLLTVVHFRIVFNILVVGAN